MHCCRPHLTGLQSATAAPGLLNRPRPSLAMQLWPQFLALPLTNYNQSRIDGRYQVARDSNDMTRTLVTDPIDVLSSRARLAPSTTSSLAPRPPLIQALLTPPEISVCCRVLSGTTPTLTRQGHGHGQALGAGHAQGPVQSTSHWIGQPCCRAKHLVGGAHGMALALQPQPQICPHHWSLSPTYGPSMVHLSQCQSTCQGMSRPAEDHPRV